MGIPSLKSAILYCVSLYLYPGPSAKKTGLFLAIRLIFDTLAKRTAFFLAGE